MSLEKTIDDIRGYLRSLNRKKTVTLTIDEIDDILMYVAYYDTAEVKRIINKHVEE